jgi:hypothetical protein
MHMGVDKFFKTLAKLASSWELLNYFSPSQETTGPKYRKDQWEGKKFLARLASGFVFLLAVWILLAFGELASGYPHPWNTPQSITQKKLKSICI